MHAGLFAERIAERHDEARLRRGERSVGGGAERAGDGFVKSRGEQCAADRGFALGPRQRAHAFAECGQRVGEAVVSVDARDFFNEVDLALEIEPPTWQRDLPCSLALRRTAASSPQPRAVSTFSTVAAVMPSGSMVVPRMRCTSLSASAMGLRLAVRASSGGNAHIDEIAFDVSRRWRAECC